jgi:hypothetical protein
MEAKECASLKKESGTTGIECFWDIGCKEDLKMSVGFSEIKIIDRDENRFCVGLNYTILGPSWR